MSKYLQRLNEEVPEELVPAVLELSDAWERKLWHQATQILLKLFKDPLSAPYRLPIYRECVEPAEDKLNPLAAVSLAISASGELGTPQAQLEFVESVAKRFDDPETRDAYVFAKLHAASLQTKLNQTYQAKQTLEECRKLVDQTPIESNAVLAQLYGTSCEYYKQQSDFSAYYRNALLYLACIDLEKLEKTVLQQRAYDLCVAALLAPKIYNFGELVLHPILNLLESDHLWLKELVLAVNSGDVARFQQLRPEFTKRSPMLAAALPFLEQKICLMALCECVFKRQQTGQGCSALPFTTIAKETSLQPGAKVEILCMKAFSLGLMRGHIDEVTKTVEISWLQPRVLSREQAASMRKRLSQWDAGVENLSEFMRERGEAVWQEA